MRNYANKLLTRCGIFRVVELFGVSAECKLEFTEIVNCATLEKEREGKTEEKRER